MQTNSKLNSDQDVLGWHQLSFCFYGTNNTVSFSFQSAPWKFIHLIIHSFDNLFISYATWSISIKAITSHLWEGGILFSKNFPKRLETICIFPLKSASVQLMNERTNEWTNEWSTKGLQLLMFYHPILSLSGKARNLQVSIKK